ncbi:hypothetical protein ACWC2K_37835 [Streptomyces chattanoogensis]|uniref:hypothetical protein n=1 Tax=Streptomyces chattanoogensis TaxID=66876 RepID=UPI0036B39616
MRNGTGISATAGPTGVADAPGGALRRLCRIPLTLVIAVLACVLAGVAAAPDVPTPALSAAVALKSDGSAPAVCSDHDGSEGGSELDAGRGQVRRAVRSSVGIPQLTGRPLPPCRTDPTSAPALASGPPADWGPTRAAAEARPLQLPVLHSVFRC